VIAVDALGYPHIREKVENQFAAIALLCWALVVVLLATWVFILQLIEVRHVSVSNKEIVVRRFICQERQFNVPFEGTAIAVKLPTIREPYIKKGTLLIGKKAVLLVSDILPGNELLFSYLIEK